MIQVGANAAQGGAVLEQGDSADGDALRVVPPAPQASKVFTLPRIDLQCLYARSTCPV